MMRAVLSFLLFAIPATLSADMVVMKDGTRYIGTFLNGTSRTITITDNSGARRSLDLTSVRQISFGDGDIGPGGYQSNSRIDPNDVNFAVGRLLDDLRGSISSGYLSNQQRMTMQRAHDRLRGALTNYNAGTRVDMQEVRAALSDVRFVADNSNLSGDDRRRLQDDLLQIDHLRVVNGYWSTESGSRTRRYDYDR